MCLCVFYNWRYFLLVVCHSLVNLFSVLSTYWESSTVSRLCNATCQRQTQLQTSAGKCAFNQPHRRASLLPVYTPLQLWQRRECCLFNKELKSAQSTHVAAKTLRGLRLSPHMKKQQFALTLIWMENSRSRKQRQTTERSWVKSTAVGKKWSGPSPSLWMLGCDGTPAAYNNS